MPGDPRTGADWLVGRLDPNTYKLDEGIQNGTCQHPYPHGRISFPKWVLPSLFLQGESQFPLASQGGSPRLASRSDPGSFKITAFALGFRVCDILYAPFKSRVAISYNPIALPKAIPTSLQIQIFWDFFLMQDP